MISTPMKIIKNHSAGDALIAALSIKEKQFDCILVRDFWSFETDKWTLVSPSGKQISIWAHSWVWDEKKADVSGFTKEINAIIARFDSYAPAAPNANYCAFSHYGRGRAIKVTRSEMFAWKTLAKLSAKAFIE